MRISDWSSDVCSSDLVAELPQQLRLAPLGPLDVAVLDVAEAADLLRHARQLDGDAVALRGQPRDDLLDRREVLVAQRSEEHTSELQSLMRNSYAVFCLKKKTTQTETQKADKVRCVRQR